MESVWVWRSVTFEVDVLELVWSELGCSSYDFDVVEAVVDCVALLALEADVEAIFDGLGYEAVRDGVVALAASVECGCDYVDGLVALCAMLVLAVCDAFYAISAGAVPESLKGWSE